MSRPPFARWIAASVMTMLTAGCGAAATVTVPPHGAVSATASASAVASAVTVSPLSTVPANPVTVLRLTGATPDKGEVYGTQGVENDQVAHGMFPGGENVWVFTYDTEAHRTYWVAHPMSGPQDGETDILGPSISLIIVDAASPASAGGPTAQQIAAKVGGTVIR